MITGPQPPSDLISCRTSEVSPWSAAIEAWRRAGTERTSAASSRQPPAVIPISIQGRRPFSVRSSGICRQSGTGRGAAGELAAQAVGEAGVAAAALAAVDGGGERRRVADQDTV